MVSRRAFVKSSGWAMAGLALGPLATTARRRHRALVCIYLQGGADGFSLLVPHGDHSYYGARPHLAIPRSATLDLDGYYGLHPGLAPLLPWWQQRQLTVLAHPGPLPAPARHADARRALEAIIPPLADAPRASALEPSLLRIARRILSNDESDVACATTGGWDTHFDQGGATGRLAARIAELGQALAAFATILGPRLRDVTLVTVTEFGRARRENRNRGTDHGDACVTLLLGGSAAGGRIIGAPHTARAARRRRVPPRDFDATPLHDLWADLRRWQRGTPDQCPAAAGTAEA